MKIIDKMREYETYLENEEKSKATIEKYMHDVQCFAEYIKDRDITKLEVIEYKRKLIEKYAHTSVNSMLVALNGFLVFIGRAECRVKLLKIQKQIFANEQKELTREEYRRLLKVARGGRISLVIRTICETGIRVSELQYITVEAVRDGKVVVACKNKTRIIFIHSMLRKDLLEYIKKTRIKGGCVFISKKGNPLNRSNIWRDMKALCNCANVAAEKVFPHNLRHLFARTFYSIERDIVRLSDILGHSNINTTRIYTVETGKEHTAYLNRVYRRLVT